MHQLSEQAALDARKRPVRVLSLLDSLARAAISPVTVRVLHELAYLTNVLAPVFDLPPFSASLLRRRGGPYYPELQETVDLLVGRRMVDVADIRYVYAPAGWRSPPGPRPRNRPRHAGRSGRPPRPGWRAS